MKPDWDKLGGHYADHPSVLIVDVDCTADGQGTCQRMGVQGYPTTVLIGRDGPLLGAALATEPEQRAAASMAEAVALAAELAEPGDLVLLSPACASFDMYDNFSARGEDFGRCVEALAA